MNTEQDEDYLFTELLDGVYAVTFWVGKQKVIMRCNDAKSADKLSRIMQDCMTSMQIWKHQKRKGK